MLPKVAVQIITYWSPDIEDQLEQLRQSLEQVDYPLDTWHLVIIDNPSPYGSSESYLRRTWMVSDKLPSIEVIFSPRNDGFAGGHDRGLACSLAWGAEYMYLLNQDTYVEPTFLWRAVQVAEADPHLALVQSRVMLAQDPELLNSCGNCMHYLGFGYSDGYRQTPEAAAKHPKPHFYASGAAVLLRSSALEKIGGLFYDDTFMYHEDVDVSWRARLAGYGVGYAPESVMYHRYEFSRSIKKFYWMERNRHLMNLLNYKWATLLLMAPPMLVMELGTLVYAAKSGWWKEKIRSWGYLLHPSTWKLIAERRAGVKKFRVATDRQMLEAMVGTIEAQEVQNPIVEKIVNPFLALYFALLKRVVKW